jgi:triosephosphate isomerase
MKKMFVANWKMQKSFNKSLAFAHTHMQELKTLTQEKHHQIVICPSFPALFNFAQFFSQTNIHVGAQTVSRHSKGAYTGQVSAQTLAEVGCAYCIIGHSETRKYQHETNIDIEHKCKELLKHNVTPIICIGESKETFEKKETYAVLEDQLKLILKAIADYNHNVKHFVIAYEPIWAIGTGIIPKVDYLSDIFAWLHKQCTKHTQTPFSLLYGGSVDANNASNILSIAHINGLLIGGASLDFDSLSNIIKANKES